MYIYVHIYVCTSLLASSSRVGIDYYLRSPVNYPAKQPAAQQLRKTISIISLTYRRHRRLPTACTPRCISILHTLSLHAVDRLYKKITIINSDHGHGYYSSRRIRIGREIASRLDRARAVNFWPSLISGSSGERMEVRGVNRGWMDRETRQWSVMVVETIRRHGWKWKQNGKEANCLGEPSFLNAGRGTRLKGDTAHWDLDVHVR